MLLRQRARGLEVRPVQRSLDRGSELRALFHAFERAVLRNLDGAHARLNHKAVEVQSFGLSQAGLYRVKVVDETSAELGDYLNVRLCNLATPEEHEVDMELSDGVVDDEHEAGASLGDADDVAAACAAGSPICG